MKVPWLFSTGTADEFAEMTVVYSYFNGVYERDGTYNRRPVYKELNKYDERQYNITTPAEIKYCQSINAWVFSHPDISKSRFTSKDEVSAMKVIPASH